MRRPADHRYRPRAQRGTVLRGVLVLAVLAGALVLQSTTPAWQSRLDAAAAFVGVTSATCQKVERADKTGASAHGPSAPGAASAGWHAGKPSLVAGATGSAAANPNPRVNATGMVAPAGFVAPAI